MKIKYFLPSILGLVISLLGLIIYILISDEFVVIKCVQMLAVPIILLVLQGLNMTKKIHIPLILHYLLLVHLVMALVLGSGMGYYDKFAWWDMLLHGYFGFVCSAFVFIILLNYDGERMKSILFFVVIFFVTMGTAGLWEIYEFVMDRLLDGDVQRIQESISQGHTPVYDTMMDMIITIVGIGCFYTAVGIDRLRKYSFIRDIYREIKVNPTLD
ncbi:MAG: hypothetical protein NC310_06560 [Roseburia sp.]|nr:hypothetical protein [Anaeroplasma bactoclasticum]MCM1196710.1 hypothetical protein [Roseburia sp.]MCM1557730.1 hypothetical protein [Anaeroplasma bactoclasticum]